MLVILKHPRGRRILPRARASGGLQAPVRGRASFVASVAGLQPPPPLSLPRGQRATGRAPQQETLLVRNAQ